MGRNLTPRQLKFIVTYVVMPNATRAAIAAGYSRESASSIGQAQALCRLVG